MDPELSTPLTDPSIDATNAMAKAITSSMMMDIRSIQHEGLSMQHKVTIALRPRELAYCVYALSLLKDRSHSLAIQKPKNLRRLYRTDFAISRHLVDRLTDLHSIAYPDSPLPGFYELNQRRSDYVQITR
jgi:hypothetical protein